MEGSRRKFMNNKEIATYRFFQFNSVAFSYPRHFVVLDSWHAKMEKKKKGYYPFEYTVGSNQTKVSIKYHLYSKTYVSMTRGKNSWVFWFFIYLVLYIYSFWGVIR